MATPTQTLSAHSAASNDSPFDLCAVPYLTQREGVYTFKRRIPAAAAQAFGRKSEQYWKSLRTRELGVALCRLDAENRWFEQLLEAANERHRPAASEDFVQTEQEVEARPVARPPLELLEAHIPYVVARYEHRRLVDDEAERRGMSLEQLKQRVQALQSELQRLRMMAARSDPQALAGQVTAELVIEGLFAHRSSTVWCQLQRSLLARARTVTERLIRRAMGEDTDDLPLAPMAPRDLPTLQTLYDAWAPSQGNVRTLQTYQYYVNDFQSVIGKLPAVALSTAHVDTYRDALAAAGLCRETVKNRVGGLATLARFTRMDDVALVFDKARLKVVPQREVHQRTRAFERTELRTFFDSPLYRRGYRPSGQAAEASYIAPVILLATGCRREEAAQLGVDDVVCIDGHWAFRISTLMPDQHLKTIASFRHVPIHQILLDCGLLDYVEQVRRAGHVRLFPSLRNDNKYRRWGNSLGSWFSRYLDDIGLADGRLCLKSFRYEFKQRCVNQGIESLVANALTGHWLDKKKKPGDAYLQTPMVQFPFPALVAAIRKLRFDDLDLSHVSFRLS